jgi:uncharacterized protein YndB with AHSA1/START domain
VDSGVSVGVKTKTIRQTVTIRATPDQVFTALMTSQGHRGFTGASARITPRVGRTFVAWGGYIHGKNLELIRGRKIVQTWRPEAEGWPRDYYSKVRYVLTPTPRGTRIEFTHSGVLAEHAGHLSRGWHESYWRPLRQYFSKARS